MTIAEHKMDKDERWYPCPLCKSEHPSVTTVLDVIGSKILMGWKQKMGTKKLLMYETLLSNEVSLDLIKDLRGRLQAKWEALGETTDFWKNGTEMSKEAADFGTIAHAAFEMHLQGRPVDKQNLPGPSKNAFEVFEKFWKENEIETIDTEKTFYNCSLGYAGTADWRGRVNGKLTLADWKTSTGIFEKNVIQCWSNVISDEMQNGDIVYEQILIGRFGKDGSTDILIVPRRGLEGGFGGYEQSRILIQACIPWFDYKRQWTQKFPYRGKQKEKI